MNNILSLINPARIIKVEDAMKLAREIVHEKTGGYTDVSTAVNHINFKALDLLQSFESLYALKLEEGHFVCKVRMPHPDDFDNDEGGASFYCEAVGNYSVEYEKVLFAGFEGGRLVTAEGVSVMFYEHQTHFKLRERTFQLVNPTIGDLFTEIERYNRTAATPAELKYTSNILSLLKIEG